MNVPALDKALAACDDLETLDAAIKELAQIKRVLRGYQEEAHALREALSELERVTAADHARLEKECEQQAREIQSLESEIENLRDRLWEKFDPLRVHAALVSHGFAETTDRLSTDYVNRIDGLLTDLGLV